MGSDVNSRPFDKIRQKETTMKSLLCVAMCTFTACTSIERSNPYDANGVNYESATLLINLPMAKAVSVVVHKITAILESPETQPISKELTLNPLGPATGTITTLKPGDNYTLTLQGFDTNGALLFEGHSIGINIAEGDTTLVEITLGLSQTIPGLN